MEINLEAITGTKKSRQEPTPEMLAPFRARIDAYIAKLYTMTPVFAEAVPHLARMLHDMQHVSLVGSDRDTGAYDLIGEPAAAVETRGLYLAGKLGTGKTTLLKIVRKITGAMYVTSSEMAAMYETGGREALDYRFGHYGQRDLIIDDLGREPDTRRFANSFPMADILCERYETWGKCGTRLHLSTNLTREEVGDRYGERVPDRLGEMCSKVVATGESLRGGK